MIGKVASGLVIAGLLTFAPATAFAAPPEPLAQTADHSSWTGFYVGPMIGWSQGYGHFSNPAVNGAPISSLFDLESILGITITNPVFTTSSNSLNPNGVVGGLRAGYNYQWGPWLAGLEGDFEGTGQTDKLTATLTGSVFRIPFSASGVGSADVSWIATVRGRFGRLLTPSLLIYGTGGLALGDMTVKDAVTASAAGKTVSQTLSDSHVLTGWTIGAGAEMRINDRISVDAQYLYVDLGKAGYRWSSAGYNETFDAGLTDNIFTVGVNVLLGPG